MFSPQIRCLPNAVKIGLLQQLLTGLPLGGVHAKAALGRGRTKRLLDGSAQLSSSSSPQQTRALIWFITDSKSGFSELA